MRLKRLTAPGTLVIGELGALLLLACTASSQQVTENTTLVRQWCFPEIKTPKTGTAMALTLVKVPVLDALSLIWTIDRRHLETELAKLVNAGTAEQLTHELLYVDEDSPVERKRGGVFQHAFMHTRSTRFGLPIPDAMDPSQIFVGTRIRLAHVQAEINWSFHYDFRYPTTYRWRNGPFWGGSSLNYTHFHTLEAGSVAPSAIDQPYLLTATDFISTTGGDPIEHTCFLLARNSKGPIDARTAHRFVQVNTIAFETSDPEITSAILLRNAATGDGALLKDLIKLAHDTPSSTRVVTQQSFLTRSGTRARVQSTTAFEYPLGFEPDFGWDFSAEGRNIQPENFRCVPNQIETHAVGNSLELELVRGSANTCDLTFDAEYAVAPPKLSPLKVNPTYAANDDPDAVEGPEFHDARISTSITIDLDAIRLVSVQTIRNTHQDPSEGGKSSFHLKFVRATSPFEIQP